MEEEFHAQKKLLTLALGSIVLFIPFFIVPFLALRLEFQRIFIGCSCFGIPFSVTFLALMLFILEMMTRKQF